MGTDQKEKSRQLGSIKFRRECILNDALLLLTLLRETYRDAHIPIDFSELFYYNKTSDVQRAFCKERIDVLMPPKPKYTKDEMIAAALELVSEKGISALTARDLGARLSTSARPIFTAFKSMEEVQDAVIAAAMKRFEEYAHKTSQNEPIFKQVGMQMILFAKEEPNLYQLIFMSAKEQAQTFDDVYSHLGSVAEECLDVLQSEYALSRSDAGAVFEHVWIHTFGIGELCATGMCAFSLEEISEMLTQDFFAMMMLMKSGK